MLMDKMKGFLQRENSMDYKKELENSLGESKIEEFRSMAFDRW